MAHQVLHKFKQNLTKHTQKQTRNHAGPHESL